MIREARLANIQETPAISARCATQRLSRSGSTGPKRLKTKPLDAKGMDGRQGNFLLSKSLIPSGSGIHDSRDSLWDQTVHGTKATDMSGDQTKHGKSVDRENLFALTHADSNFKRITGLMGRSEVPSRSVSYMPRPWLARNNLSRLARCRAQS